MHIFSKPQWSIPGVGLLRPCIDRVLIVSTMSVGALKKRLPIAAISEVSHIFATPLTYNGPHPRLQSTLNLTCGGTPEALLILQAHETSLGSHSVVQAELAFDVRAGSIGEARSKQFSLIAILGKRRHRRGFLRTEDEPAQTPPAGCVSEPTWFFEDRRAGVKIKCYIRHEKLPGGAFGGLVVRLEWTLKGKPSIDRYLGGNKISHLINADLNSFLKRNVRVEQVDHVALGKFFPHPPSGLDRDHGGGRDHHLDQCHGRDYWARRAALFVLRRLAHQEYAQNRFASWDQALSTCQNSPAQIRGYFRQLMDKKRRRKRGRPAKHAPQQRLPITEYRLNRCFRKIALTEEDSPV